MLEAGRDPSVSIHLMNGKLKFFLFAAVLTLAIGIAIWIYGVSIERDAAQVIGDVEIFTAAGANNEAFKTLQLKYGTRMRKVDGCIESHCSYELAVNNRLYSILHLSPFTELNARFDRSTDDHLVMITYSIENRVFLHVQTYSCLGRCPSPYFKSFYINPWQSVITTERFNGIVQLESNASPMLMKTAFGFNLNCFTKFGGCNDIAEMLPTAWQPVSSGVIKCVIPNRTGAADSE